MKKKKVFYNIAIICKKYRSVKPYLHLSFLKVFYERVLSFIIKVPYKDVLLSVITCRHLSMTYYTQMYL